MSLDTLLECCQLIPRSLWLDKSGKQLVQWPVQEIESLRGKKVSMSNVKLGPGQHVEVKGITAAQVYIHTNIHT